MTYGHSEFPAAAYDAWKLDPSSRGYGGNPAYDYDYEDRDDDECDHDEYDFDILSGRADCYACGHSWYPEREQERQERRDREYARAMRRAERKQWWADFTRPARRLIGRLLGRKDEVPFTVYDEIPF